MKYLILSTVLLTPLLSCGSRQMILTPPVLEDAGGSGYVDVTWYGIDISFSIDASVEEGVEACVQGAGGWIDYCSVFTEPESEGSGEEP